MSRGGQGAAPGNRSPDNCTPAQVTVTRRSSALPAEPGAAAARLLLEDRDADGLVAALDVRGLPLERHLLLGASTDGKLARLEAGAVNVEPLVLFGADVAESLHGVEPEH